MLFAFTMVLLSSGVPTNLYNTDNRRKSPEPLSSWALAAHPASAAPCLPLPLRSRPALNPVFLIFSLLNRNYFNLYIYDYLCKNCSGHLKIKF